MSTLHQRLTLVGLLLVALLAGCQKTPPLGSPSNSTAEAPAGSAASSTGPAVAGDSPALTELESSLSAVYDNVSQSVVNIQIVGQAVANPHGMPGEMPFFYGQPGGELPKPQPRRGSGSGFVWDTSGHIVTNNHVVDGADKITVNFSDGTTTKATLVGRDPDSDLAVVKVDLPADRLHPVTLQDSTTVKVGQLAVAIGNPFGLEGTMTVGFISAIGRSLPTDLNQAGPTYTIPDVIQTDAPINPGNSGGVLVNKLGRVIGVPSAIVSPAGASAGIGFAIPSTIVQKVVPVLLKSGAFEHPWIGISGVTINPDMAKAMGLPDDQRGGLVAEVISGGPADKAGVQGGARTAELDGVPMKIGGDIVIAIGGTPVKRFDDIITWLARHANVGDAVKLTVLRNKKQKDLTIKLEARPSSQKDDQQMAAAAEAPGAWLGLSGTTLEPPLAKAMNLKPDQKGVLVGEVVFDGPADKAGLKGSDRRATVEGEELLIGGDVIVAADGKPLQSMQQLQTLLSSAKPGDKKAVTVLRDGQKAELQVTLGEPPQ